jgi:hypothetical protein
MSAPNITQAHTAQSRAPAELERNARAHMQADCHFAAEHQADALAIELATCRYANATS